MVKFRPLEKIRSIIQQAIGLDIMYAYDDLVFVEHGIILFQFDDENEDNLICYLNKDFDLDNHHDQLDKLIKSFNEQNISIHFEGKFEMKQVNEEIKLEFLKEEIKL